MEGGCPARPCTSRRHRRRRDDITDVEVRTAAGDTVLELE